MATSGPLEDHITCCVCTDVYQDPHALKCLHTLCWECVKQLEKGGRVQCPECRQYTDMVDVKKDFKTGGLVDLYNAKKIVSASLTKWKPEAKQTKLCEMCNEADKPIAVKCEDCEQYLCKLCEKKHGKLKTCMNHKITPVQDIVKIALAKLRKTLQMLKSEKHQISNMSNGINGMVRDINKTRGRQVENIKHCKKEIIKKIEIHCEELIKTINKSNGDSITKLKILKENYSKSEIALQSHMQLVTDLIQSQDISVLTEGVENIDDEIRDEVKQMKHNLPKIHKKVSSPVNILYRKDFNPENIVSVQVELEKIPMPAIANHKFQNLTYDKNSALVQRKSITLVSYSGLLNHIYKQVKHVKVENIVSRMFKVNNELWADSYGDIKIYNQDYKLLRTLKLNNVAARGIAYSSVGEDSVIISHDDSHSLHQYNMEGKHIAEISTGCDFADVFCDQLTGRLYSLVYRPSISVLVYIHIDGRWVKESHIPVKYNKGSCYDRLWVCQDKIYISSSNHNCIYAFTNDGKQLWKAGERGKGSPGKMGEPELSSVDSEGNILVADYLNNRLQLYSPDSRKWGVLRLDGVPVCPRQAVIGVDGKTIWVNTSQFLIKYCIKV